MKLVPDFERHVLLGNETIQFYADAGEVEWQKQSHLHIAALKVAQGTVTVAEQSVTMRVPSSGRHDVRFQFEAAEGRGVKWFAGNAVLATVFIAKRGWSVTIPLASEPHFNQLLQFRVLRLGLLKDGDVGIGLFPEVEEVLVGGFRSASISTHRVGAAEL